MALTIEQVKEHMVRHEGEVGFMYLDRRGKVTVGIGNMLPLVSAAQALRFINRATKKGALAPEIKADFESVAKQTFNPYPGFRYYEKYTALVLPKLAITNLFQTRVDGFTRQLQRYFPDYETFPDPAQLALLDMVFNLGGPALDTKWPSLKKAVLAQDWLVAEQQCNRKTCTAKRNAETKALFREAAARAAGGK